MPDHVPVTRHDLAHPLGPYPVDLDADARTPRVCYCLATAPRNGSTMLANALWRTGLLGWPEEYLRPADVPRWAAKWGVEPPEGDSWGSFLRAVGSAATTPNGVCGVKLFPAHVMALPESAFDDPATAFGADEVKLVHLRRRDKARAGLSEWKAQVSGQWVRLPGEEKVEPPRAPSTDEITRYHDFQHAWDWFWRASRSNGIEWVELFYEDLVGDVRGALDRVAGLVGVTLPETLDLATRTVRQADPRDDEWLARWAEDTGGCRECGHT